MMLSTMLLMAAIGTAQPDTHADFSPLAKSNNFTMEFQWKAIEACPRVNVRLGQNSSGSAVVLAIKDGHAWALTASHVLREGIIIEAEFFVRDSYPAPRYTLKGLELVTRNAAADIALVKIPIGEKDPTPPTLKLAQPGARLKAFTFSALAIGSEGGSSARCYDEIVTAKRFIHRPDDKAAFFWETLDISGHGRSGGPLLNKDGNVIGICAANQDGHGYFTHSDEIHAWLKTSGYDWLWKNDAKK